MSAYSAMIIKQAYDADGLEAGQARYRALFISTKIYSRYKADADTILSTDGYGDCIVNA